MANELITYLFIWFIYFGMIVAAKDKEHISVTMLVNTFKGKGQDIFYIISNGLWLYFNIYVTVISIQLIDHLFQLGNLTAMLKISVWVLYIVLPLCFIWTSIYIVRDMIFQIRKLVVKKGEL